MASARTQSSPRFLVTGGAGFIGSAAPSHLVGAGHEALNADKLTYAGNLVSLRPIEKQPDHRSARVDICDQGGDDGGVRELMPDACDASGRRKPCPPPARRRAATGASSAPTAATISASLICRPESRQCLWPLQARRRTGGPRRQPAPYDPAREPGRRRIAWPVAETMVSDKDRNAPLFADAFPA